MTADPTAPPLRVTGKWRPSLGLVMVAVLTTVLSLPLLGLLFLHIYETHLVRQTEAELIGQSAMFAAVVRREIETNQPSDLPLGAFVPERPPRKEALENSDEDTGPYRPVLPSLDLAMDDVRPTRPEARAPIAPSPDAFRALGTRLTPDLIETQRVTLAGFRLLDFAGVVIGGRGEIGQSLAHVEEIAVALTGRPCSVLRLRVSPHAPPLLRSISRGTGVRVFVAMPVIVRSHVAAVVYASRTPLSVFKDLYQDRWKIALAGISVILLTALIGLLFHRAITDPVQTLIARIRAIEAGDHTAIRPLNHHGTAEFAVLAQGLLTMATTLTRRSDFLSSFVAHVSHELKSPLTAIRGAAELLRDDVGVPSGAMSDNERRHFLDNILADTNRLAALVQRLRELARAETSPTIGLTQPTVMLDDLRIAFPALTFEGCGDLETPLGLSRDNARIILGHLADNAAHHGAQHLTIKVLRGADTVQVTISDDGNGISPNNRARVFDAFFTTRRESGGTGMGLAIVRALLTVHGGWIELMPSNRITSPSPDPAPVRGTTFRLTLPTVHEGGAMA
jgi:signal transduction histidine kinase